MTVVCSHSCCRTAAMFAVSASAAAAALGGVPVALGGPVQVVGQERRITAQVDDSGLQQASAPDASPFNVSVTATSEGDGFSNTSMVDMNSVLSGGRFSFVGSIHFDGNDSRVNSDPNAQVDTRFSGSVFGRGVLLLDQAYNYKLTYEQTPGETPQGWNILSDSEARFIDPNDPSNSLLQNGETREGVLQPGEYTLQIAAARDGVVPRPTEGDFSEDYSLILDLTPVGGGGDNGGGTPAVPLPPAVWTGAMVLGAGLLNRLRKRREI